MTRFKDGEFKSYTIEDGLVNNTVLAICEDRQGNLWIGTDGGHSWTSINDGLPPGNRATSELQLFVNPQTPATVYVNSDKGFFKSNDGGSHWLATSLQMMIRTLAVDPANGATLYVGYESWGDAFVARLNAAGSALIYSTYLGGLRVDLANGVAVDALGNAWIRCPLWIIYPGVLPFVP